MPLTPLAGAIVTRPLDECDGPRITVVIPAFKADFLPQALESLAAQTDQNFQVVVADDGSPSDLRTICMAFAERLNLHYVRFDTNLGGTNLVSHWTRAIDAASTEWIWLLGDDDELEPECLKAVRRALAKDPTWQGLWHVDVIQINVAGDLEKMCASFPAHLDVTAYILARCAGELSSFACEYIFRRSNLRDLGGLVSFPLAWCSDDATWGRLAGPHGIRTVRAPNARARWRRSTVNISGGGARLNDQKLEARVQYVEWLNRTDTRDALGFDATDIRNLRRALWSWFLSGLHSSRTQMGVADVWRVGRRIGAMSCESLVRALYELMRCRRWIADSVRRDLHRNAPPP